MKRLHIISLCFIISGIATLVAPAFLPCTAAVPPKIAVISSATPLKRAIAAQKGRVVVLNFWATWCGPCVAEFPTLVKLQGSHANDVTVITVSQDKPKDIPGKVRPFLARQGASFPQFLLSTHDPDAFINAFDPKWQGDLPRTFVYDRSGRLAKVLIGPQTQASFNAAVSRLISKR